MQETLFSSEKVAAVSSHIFWDPQFKFLLPSSYPRALLEIQALFNPWPPQAFIHRFLSGIWRYHSIRVWLAQRPVRVTNLSGSVVLLKVGALRQAGGLFDPRFFLYFEDTDLFIRLRQKGYSLLVEPRARAVHYYDQCGVNHREHKRSLLAHSHALFLQKHGKPAMSRVRRGADRFFTGTGIGRRYETQPPDFMAPFTLNIPKHLREGWLFEWSPFPTLLPSVGRFGKGPVMEFPPSCWEMLAPGQYYGRFGKIAAFGRYSDVVSWCTP